MRRLGISSHSGGSRGERTRLRNQMKRLFRRRARPSPLASSHGSSHSASGGGRPTPRAWPGSSVKRPVWAGRFVLRQGVPRGPGRDRQPHHAALGHTRRRTTSRRDPETTLVLKGNKPLKLRIHRRHRVILYASDAAYLDAVLDDERGWHELPVPPHEPDGVPAPRPDGLLDGAVRISLHRRSGTRLAFPESERRSPTGCLFR